MARTIRFRRFDEVLHSISDRVGGPRDGGDAIDVVLIQYLLNRRDQNQLDKPYGAQRALALDGVMGPQTHYRLLHFIVHHYGIELAKPRSEFVATAILPIPTVLAGVPPKMLVLNVPMALLSAQAYATGPKPTAAKVSLPDMPYELVQALEKDVTDL